jgi:hypothetical protein
MRTASLQEALSILAKWKTEARQLGRFGGTLDKVPSLPTGPLREIKDVPSIPTSTILVLSSEGLPDRSLDLKGSSFRVEDATLPKPWSVERDDTRVGVTVGPSSFWSEALEITTSDGSETLAAKHPASP